VPRERRQAYVTRLLAELVAPGGRLLLCGYGSPRSGVQSDPVHAAARGLGFEPELSFCSAAPEGGGAIVELAVLRAG
jgi:hypothetical protein